MTPAVRTLPDDLHLKEGTHADPDAGMCVMEAVAYVAGEPHSDHPACASEPIAAFMRSWNDNLPTDEARDRLLGPFVARLVDSKSTPAVEEYRCFLAFDWLIRVYTPKWLDLLPACADHAAALRALAPVIDLETAKAAEPKASAAESAAWSAARSAAESAAWSAARSAAESAARSAAWSAAWSAARSAARSAAWSAARSAAWSAARSAAESAAGAALLPTRDQVQALAVDLVERMLAVTPETLPAGWVPPSRAAMMES